jgi:hypothetical protein
MGIWFFAPLRSAKTFFKRKKIEKKKVAMERRRGQESKEERNKRWLLCKGYVFMP